MKKTAAIVLLFVFCCLCLCGCAEKSEPVPVTSITFSAGEIPVDSQEISIVLQSGETQLLDELTQLRSADFSGSECYEEILAWSQKNADVDVLYTLTLPDGSVVDNRISKLDLSKTDVNLFKETASLIKYLSKLESVDLSGSSRVISMEDYQNISSANPELSYSALFKLNGQSISTSASQLDMTGLSAADAEELCLILPAMTNLKTVELGNQESSPELSFAQVSALQKACPNADFIYGFTLFNKSFTSMDTTMDLNHIKMRDGGAAVMEALSCMPKLEYLDMDSCKVSDEDMAKIRDAYPDVKVVWRIWFGDNYSVRTDVEKILASMPSAGGFLTVENCESLKYCTDVKYLDLGHNETLKDISFINYMPKLEVVIVAMDHFSDVSPLANCPNLEFLEIQTSKVADITPLAGLTKLRHLNICYLPELDDISPIMDLELERLWIGTITPIPQEQIDEYQRRHPDCRISTTNLDPHDGGWRYDQDENGAWGKHPRYEILVEQFGYDRAAYSFSWKDPLY